MSYNIHNAKVLCNYIFHQTLAGKTFPQGLRSVPLLLLRYFSLISLHLFLVNLPSCSMIKTTYRVMKHSAFYNFDHYIAITISNLYVYLYFPN